MVWNRQTVKLEKSEQPTSELLVDLSRKLLLPLG
jgi:hypothetical protein